MAEESKQIGIERHYSPAEIAERMGLSPRTICRLVENEPGIVKIGERGLMRTRITLRIPESVWKRVHEKLTVKIGDGDWRKPHRRRRA